MGGSQTGFTIIELMMVVVIAAVLAMVAAPSMHDLMSAQRVRSAASDLYDSVLLARSEAIKRNATVSMVPAGGGWVAGWTVQDAGGNTLLQREAVAGVTITANTIGNLSFRIDGRVSSNVRDFTVAASPAIAGIRARCVLVSASGRPTVRTDNDTDATNGCV